MEVLLKIGKALLDIWNIIKGVMMIFKGKKQEEENKKEKEDIEQNIKNGDITDLNEELGWKDKP